MRAVRRHGIGVSVAESLETAAGHIIRQKPAENFFRAELGKLKIAAGRGWQIEISVPHQTPHLKR